MSVNINAVLWYGIQGDVTEDILDELVNGESEHVNQYDEYVIEGIHIHVVWDYDKAIGYGATLVHAGEYSGSVEVDQSSFDKTVFAVQQYLNRQSVREEPKIYLSALYS